MAEAPENQRAALVERIAGLIERETGVKDDATADEAAEAVLSLLESGRAGVWLVPAVGVLDTVGVVITQLRDTKAELVDARAEVERLRMACATQSHGVEQILGKALRYPAYGPEMFPDGVPDGSVCVGDHVPESLAEEAADLIERLRDSVSYWQDRAYEAEHVRWDDSVAPGGEVCATCGIPVEDEPCSAHAPVPPSEIERLRAQVADLLPYAWAGADALEVWEPYGPDWEGPHGEDPWRGDPARTMLDRITAGEFGEVPS